MASFHSNSRNKSKNKSKEKKTKMKSKTKKRTNVRATNRAKTKSNWSKNVTLKSNAMDLESGVFTLNDPHKIALSLKRSALSSNRLKSTPFKSAMSMLNFYINRAGSNLSSERLKVLNEAKNELRIVFNTGKII
jgi:hypothetical protein